ncbi:MAG: head-tail connector protein [Silicimonas sp.]|uniref:head-tail connector protein n=1 Tax=Alphaproteobacteria TaxID=28211 RepID=UPI0032EC0929
MAAQTSLTLLKSQLNLDHDLDDELLAHKLSAAEEWIYKFTGRDFSASNPAMTEAALQLAAYWYEQREAASFGQTTAPVPFGVRDLLSPYRSQVTGHVAD